jgi:hypothetical protein
VKPLYLLLIFLIPALLLPASGCESDGSKDYTATELIPARSNLVAGIQISEIASDRDIKNTYDNMEKEADNPQTFDEALDMMHQESGMDINDFSHALIFGDVRDNDIEQVEYFGFVAEGDFDEDELIKSIEENSEERFSTSNYKDHKLYISENEEFAITFLNEKILLGGMPEAVRDSIDVSNGDGQPVAGQLLDTYNRNAGALISLAMKVPEDSQDTLTDDAMMSDMPLSMDAFSGMDVVGFSLDKDDETLDSRIELHFLEADSVQDAHDTISGMFSMFKGMMEDPDLKEFMGNIEVSVSGSWLTIAFGIELSQIEDMKDTFGGTFGSTFGE